jgi:hypothetical protein
MNPVTTIAMAIIDVSMSLARPLMRTFLRSSTGLAIAVHSYTKSPALDSQKLSAGAVSL